MLKAITTPRPSLSPSLDVANLIRIGQHIARREACPDYEHYLANPNLANANLANRNLTLIGHHRGHHRPSSMLVFLAAA